jgi:hypothetical protein
VTGSGGTGTAAKSTGNNRGDPSYMAKIAAKVRSIPFTVVLMQLLVIRQLSIELS